MLQDFLWWILPDNVGLTLAAIIAVSGIITCLIFDSVAPRIQAAYVPRKRRKHKSYLPVVIIDALEQCATTITERINNMKVRCRSHHPKLCYSGHRRKRKKGKHVLSVPLTGMTTTWSNERINPPGTFD